MLPYDVYKTVNEETITKILLLNILVTVTVHLKTF